MLVQIPKSPHRLQGAISRQEPPSVKRLKMFADRVTFCHWLTGRERRLWQKEVRKKLYFVSAL